MGHSRVDVGIDCIGKETVGGCIGADLLNGNNKVALVVRSKAEGDVIGDKAS